MAIDLTQANKAIYPITEYHIKNTADGRSILMKGQYPVKEGTSEYNRVMNGQSTGDGESSSGGSSSGGGSSEGYGGGMNDAIQGALDRYYAMQDYAMEQYKASITPSKYEPIYKGEFDELDAELAATYAKLEKAASLVPDDEMLNLITQAAAPGQSQINTQKAEAMKLNAAAWVRKGGSLSDPEFMKTQAKTAKPYDDASSSLFQNLMTTMPKALYENYYTQYSNLANQKASYLSGATSLDEAVRQRQAGGAGTFAQIGAQGASNAINSGLALQELNQQQNQWEQNFAQEQKKWEEQKKLAEDYADAYEDNNSWFSKILGVGGTALGTALGGPLGGLITGGISNLFGGGGSTSSGAVSSDYLYKSGGMPQGSSGSVFTNSWYPNFGSGF